MATTVNSDDISIDWQRGRSPAAMIAKLEGFEAAFFERELPKAAEEIGLKIEASAKENAPVDTGTLRASIAQDVERVVAHTVKALIGTNVEYSIIQEVEQPYLRPAIEQNRDYIKERVKQAFENAVSIAS